MENVNISHICYHHSFFGSCLIPFLLLLKSTSFHFSNDFRDIFCSLLHHQSLLILALHLHCSVVVLFKLNEIFYLHCFRKLFISIVLSSNNNGHQREMGDGGKSAEGTHHIGVVSCEIRSSWWWWWWRKEAYSLCSSSFSFSCSPLFILFFTINQKTSQEPEKKTLTRLEMEKKKEHREVKKEYLKTGFCRNDSNRTGSKWCEEMMMGRETHSRRCRRQAKAKAFSYYTIDR